MPKHERGCDTREAQELEWTQPWESHLVEVHDDDGGEPVEHTLDEELVEDRQQSRTHKHPILDAVAVVGPVPQRDWAPRIPMCRDGHAMVRCLWWNL